MSKEIKKNERREERIGNETCMDWPRLLYYRVAFDDVIVVVNKPTESNNTISLGGNKVTEENDVDEIIFTMSDFDLAMSMPDVEKYIGKWVSVIDHEIVAIGDSLEEVYLEAIKKRKDCNSVPYVVMIPTGDPMILVKM